MKWYRHKKTGAVYRIITHATDCTNSRDGTKVIVYIRKIDGMTFVREETEFYEKFEQLPFGDNYADV